jgi:hypothetical protein
MRGFGFLFCSFLSSEMLGRLFRLSRSAASEGVIASHRVSPWRDPLQSLPSFQAKGLKLMNPAWNTLPLEAMLCKTRPPILRGKSPNLALGICVAVATGNVDKALTLLRQWPAGNPPTYVIRSIVAGLVSLGRRDDATKLFEGSREDLYTCTGKSDRQLQLLLETYVRERNYDRVAALIPNLRAVPADLERFFKVVLWEPYTDGDTTIKRAMAERFADSPAIALALKATYLLPSGYASIEYIATQANTLPGENKRLFVCIALWAGLLDEATELINRLSLHADQFAPELIYAYIRTHQFDAAVALFIERHAHLVIEDVLPLLDDIIFGAWYFDGPTLAKTLLDKVTQGTCIDTKQSLSQARIELDNNRLYEASAILNSYIDRFEGLHGHAASLFIHCLVAGKKETVATLRDFIATANLQDYRERAALTTYLVDFAEPDEAVAIWNRLIDATGCVLELHLVVRLVKRLVTQYEARAEAATFLLTLDKLASALPRSSASAALLVDLAKFVDSSIVHFAGLTSTYQISYRHWLFSNKTRLHVLIRSIARALKAQQSPLKLSLEQLHVKSRKEFMIDEALQKRAQSITAALVQKRSVVQQ